MTNRKNSTFCKDFWRRILHSRLFRSQKIAEPITSSFRYSDSENYIKQDVPPPTSSFKKLDKYCWYWGPLSWLESEEKLSGKPDGSFLVRDSTDDNHLLTLSFRSQGKTRHFRFNSNRGKFIFFDSLGADSCEAFIDMAMSSSREGSTSYLFHKPHFGSAPGMPDLYAGRRPSSIPVELQLLVPLNRFCTMNSLKHLCRNLRKLVSLMGLEQLLLLSDPLCHGGSHIVLMVQVPIKTLLLCNSYAILSQIPRHTIEHLPVPEPLKSYLREPRYLIESSSSYS